MNVTSRSEFTNTASEGTCLRDLTETDFPKKLTEKMEISKGEYPERGAAVPGDVGSADTSRHGWINRSTQHCY